MADDDDGRRRRRKLPSVDHFPLNEGAVIKIDNLTKSTIIKKANFAMDFIFSQLLS